MYCHLFIESLYTYLLNPKFYLITVYACKSYTYYICVCMRIHMYCQSLMRKICSWSRLLLTRCPRKCINQYINDKISSLKIRSWTGPYEWQSSLMRSQGQCGKTAPLWLKWTLLQRALVGPLPLLDIILMSCNTIPSHGKLLLQSNFIATSEALVPLMFW